ncbi:MAG: DUF4105 domain-containing protein [Proteobacteria bacterium]|nr:DUF4105 domain-containing protein [Pseudomonadota bacterium]
MNAIGRVFFKTATFLLLILLANNEIYALELPPLPQDLDQVKIYLHSVDAGDPIYSKFGHTAVRIYDPVGLTDQVFNLGIFDDSDPMFAVNFYTGVMYYIADQYPFNFAMRTYRIEKRKVWQDELMLNARQKLTLIEKLYTQAAPENRSYPYQYFFDNCSTRIRDFIDFALDGSLKKSVDGKLSEDTFRDTVRSHMSTFSFGAMSLDILMNARLDRSMTQWEEMYLPLRLRIHLQNLRSDSGSLILAPESVLVEGAPPIPSSLTSYFWFMAMFAVSLGISFLALIVLKLRWLGLLAFKMSLLLWSIFSGIFGLVMVMNWTLSSHEDLHHNANLWIFCVFDFLLLYLLLKPKVQSDWRQSNLLKFLNYYCVLRALMLVSAFVLSQFSMIRQDIAPVYLTFGVAGFVVLLGSTLLIRDQRS